MILNKPCSAIIFPGQGSQYVGMGIALADKYDVAKKVFDEVLPLVSAYMQPQNLYKNNSGDAAIRRLAAKVQRIDRLVRLARADHSGRSPQRLEDCPIADWLIKGSC